MPIKIVRNKGFTLVEVLVYSGIFAIIAIAVVGAGIGIIEAKAKMAAAAKIRSCAVSAYEFISSRIRESSSIIEPAPGAVSEKLVVSYHSGSTLQIMCNGGRLTAVHDNQDEVPLAGRDIGFECEFRNLGDAETMGSIGIDLEATAEEIDGLDGAVAWSIKGAANAGARPQEILR
jgi:type II secretory pathway pseudopilin PulG